jgi:hypothetical protein
MWNQVDLFEASTIFSRHVVSQILNFLKSCSTGFPDVSDFPGSFCFSKTCPEKFYNLSFLKGMSVFKKSLKVKNAPIFKSRKLPNFFAKAIWEP